MELSERRHAYFPNLDGLRFFAFLSVFVSHSMIFFGYENHAPGFLLFRDLFLVHGDLGVNFFFVLSGFLITYLLFREKEEAGGIDVPAFYLRRIFRIWPVYFAVLLLGFVIVPWLVSALSAELPFSVATPVSRIGWFVAFLANIDLSFFAGTSALVGVLWSISVEEQFYLAWPLFVKRATKALFPVGVALLIIISALFRFFVADDYEVSKYFTLSVFSDLAVGAGLAWMIFFVPRVERFFRNLSRPAIISVYMILFLLIPFKGGLSRIMAGTAHDIAYALLPLAFSVVFASIIAEQNFSRRSFWKAGRVALATRLGRISYGLYAYHLVALAAVFMLLDGHIPVPYESPILFVSVFCLAFCLTVGISVVSFRFLESPFLRYKNRFSHGVREMVRGGLES